MVRARFEVNARALTFSLVRRALFFTLAVSITLSLVACGGRERKAERLYREASKLVERGELDEAVKKLERIVGDYRDTEAARKARDEIVVYRGLAEATHRYPERRASEVMIRTARAIERYHEKRKQWPSGLSDLVPGELTSLPDDPWGNPLAYERKAGGKGYRLRCLGADRAPGGADADADILVEDGKFLAGGPSG